MPWGTTKQREPTIGTSPNDVIATRIATFVRCTRRIRTERERINDAGLWMLKRCAFAAYTDIRELERQERPA